MEREPHRPAPAQGLPEPGSEAYRQEMRRGATLIERYRMALARAEKAPMYSASGINADGNAEGIQENLSPWEAVDQAADTLRASQSAVRILTEHGFSVEEASPEGGTLIRNVVDGLIVRSRELPRLQKEGK